MKPFLIKVENATVYRGDNQVLTGINWTHREGENWAVVGNNGCGKTTFMKLLFGELLPIDGGEVFWFNSREWYGLFGIRERVGFVSAEFQKNYDQNVTALEVVESGFFSSIGLWEEVQATQTHKAQAEMEHLGIPHLASRRFFDLSYGEARRVLLARALVHRPQLLVLDEPCAGLDIPTRERFLDSLAKRARRMSLIYVTHHIEEILPAITHVLLLKNGRIFAAGKKQDLLTSDTFSEALDCRATVQENDGRFWITGCQPDGAR
ncbi:ABC transporter ATP-binding protein [Nitrospina watsonii]|uniref:ABC transporter related n=1 Tax=Nitrospina watsonii TaxID=1323948 RepID=A0ABM9HFW2_9BACT|nr:ATP-binding cassette domain-containing protein [Nitrospina watsonii]CAI2718947.1 ABC transporter related [Nitrospina watsonii]